MVNENGYGTEFDYDSKGRVINIIAPKDFHDPINNGGTTIFPSTIKYEYQDISIGADPINLTITKRKSLETGDIITKTTFNSYLKPENLFLTHETGNHQSITTYDFHGRTETETDFNGNTVTYEYDELNRVTRVINADISDINYSYIAVNDIPGYSNLIGWTTGIDFGMKKTVKDENNHQTVVYEDALGQVRKEVSYRGASPPYTIYGETFYDYDALGNVIKVLNPEGQLNTFEYDDIRRLTESNSPDIGTTKYRYDGNSNLIFKQFAERASDSNYGWIYYKYDDLNRIMEEGLANTPPGNEPDNSPNDIVKKSYYYDKNIATNSIGRLSVIQDTESRVVTKYDYDGRGRISNNLTYYNASVEYQEQPETEEVHLPDGSNTHASYEVVIDHDQTIHYTLISFGFGGVAEILVYRNGNTIFNEIIDYQGEKTGDYDVMESDQVTIKCSYLYDDCSAEVNYSTLLNEIQSIEGDAAYSIEYNTYNSANLLTEMTYTDGSTVDFTYNKLGKLESIPGYLDGSNGIGFEYNPNGAVTKQHFNNNVSFTNSYNTRNWLENTTQQTGHPYLKFDQVYSYYDNGNLQTETLFPDEDMMSPNIRAYYYDEFDRLSSAIQGVGPGEDRWFFYDKLGNRDTTIIEGVLTVHEYNVPTNNRLLGDVGRSGNLTYDANGNLKYDPNTGYHYVYDWNNRLIKVYKNMWVTWSELSGSSLIFKVQNGAVRFIGDNDTGAKHAEKPIAPIIIDGSDQLISINFELQRKSKIDMDYTVFSIENNDGSAGFLMSYFGRKKLLLAQQFKTVKGKKIFKDIYVNGYLKLELDKWAKGKFIIDATNKEVSFEFIYGNINDMKTIELIQGINQLNKLSFQVNEADFLFDNVSIAADNNAPFIHVEDFDSDYDNSLSGVYTRYYYNPSGDRAMKISPDGITKYITDGNMNVLSEYDVDGTLNYNYVYGNGQKLARVKANGTNKEYIHNDYLGSVRRISDQNGDLVWGRDYYPFGEDRLTYGGTNEDNDYTYEGKEKDLETDLWYNTARFFNDAGRFTQVDPLWAKYPNISPYVRVLNNPLNVVDINGAIPITRDQATYLIRAIASFETINSYQRGYDEAMRYYEGIGGIDNRRTDPPVGIYGFSEKRDLNWKDYVKSFKPPEFDGDPNVINGKITIFGVIADVQVWVHMIEDMNISYSRSIEGSEKVIIEYLNSNSLTVAFLTLSSQDYKRIMDNRKSNMRKGAQRYRDDNKSDLINSYNAEYGDPPAMR